VGKPEVRGPLGRYRDKWEVYSIDWIDLAKDKDRWGCSYECGYEPWGSTEFGKFLDYLSTC